MSNSRTFSLTVALALALAAFAPPARALGASTYTVTRPDDPVPNGCKPTDCSLREAIMTANASLGAMVRLPAGTYTLTIPGADTSATNAAIGDVDILAGMTVSGAGRGSTIVQAGTGKGLGIHRVFDVHSSSGVSISNMTIRFGTDTEGKSGGCIKNAGVLTLDSVVVTGCTTSVTGGAIASYNMLTVRDSVVSQSAGSSADPKAMVAGGGIAGGPRVSGAPGVVNIIRSQITGNSVANTGGGTAYGGGFANTGTMTISDSTISGNAADSSAGGISDPRLSNPDGSMTIERSTISGNRARLDGGGMTTDGRLAVVDSTFSDNEAGYHCTPNVDCNRAFAGGLLNTATGSTTVQNSTFSGNRCLVSGGGLLSSLGGTLSIYNSTIVGNSCDLGAGLSSNASAQTFVKNTIVADNPAGATGGDCSGQVTSQGYNVIRKTTGCAIVGNATGNVINTDPKVGALQDNGGPTRTRALLVGSPALNAGDPSGCTDPFGNQLPADQRGLIRPSMGRCDIGAYERGTSVILWATANRALAWQLNGSSFVTSTGFDGPGTGWAAQSYSGENDGSYRLLWSSGNAAQLWKLRANNTFASSTGFTGPGAAWTATSVFLASDGGYELLWTTDNGAQVWKINANGSRGGALILAGPGAGWRATSYCRATDQSRRVMWTKANRAVVGTLTANGAPGASQGLSGPGVDWTATSYNLNADGTFNILWAAADAQAQLWTVNANGTISSQTDLQGPANWTSESYFFK